MTQTLLAFMDLLLLLQPLAQTQSVYDSKCFTPTEGNKGHIEMLVTGVEAVKECVQTIDPRSQPIEVTKINVDQIIGVNQDAHAQLEISNSDDVIRLPSKVTSAERISSSNSVLDSARSINLGPLLAGVIDQSNIGGIGSTAYRERGNDSGFGRVGYALTMAGVFGSNFGTSQEIDWVKAAVGSSYVLSIPLAGGYSKFFAAGADRVYQLEEVSKLSLWGVRANVPVIIYPLFKHGFTSHEGWGRAASALAMSMLQGPAYAICRKSSGPDLILAGDVVFTECGEYLTGMFFAGAAYYAMYEPEIDDIDYERLLFEAGGKYDRLNYLHILPTSASVNNANNALVKAKREQEEDFFARLEQYQNCVSWQKQQKELSWYKDNTILNQLVNTECVMPKATR